MDDVLNQPWRHHFSALASKQPPPLLLLLPCSLSAVEADSGMPQAYQRFEGARSSFSMESPWRDALQLLLKLQQQCVATRPLRPGPQLAYQKQQQQQSRRCLERADHHPRNRC